MSEASTINAMRWPSLRAKLFPIVAVEVSWSWAPWVHVGGNPFHGNWWTLSFGRWMILGGGGTYE